MRLYFKLLAFFILVSFRSFSNDCGTTTVPLGTADGSFSSCGGVALTNTFNGNVTCGGWTNGGGTSADSWHSPVPFGTWNNLAAGLPSSPDDSVFAAVIHVDDYIETFYTVLENLSIGEKYTVTFYYANAGADDYTEKEIK